MCKLPFWDVKAQHKFEQICGFGYLLTKLFLELCDSISLSKRNGTFIVDRHFYINISFKFHKFLVLEKIFVILTKLKKLFVFINFHLYSIAFVSLAYMYRFLNENKWEKSCRNLYFFKLLC